MKIAALIIALLLSLSAVAAAAATSPFAGQWDGEFATPGPKGEMTLKLESGADAWRGHVKITGKDGVVAEDDVRDVKVAGDSVTFTATLEGATVTFTGKVNGDKLAGTIDIREAGNTIPGTWSLSRSPQ